MVLDADLQEAAIARIVRLKTMGFSRQEIRPILEAEFRTDIDETEFLGMYHQMTTDFASMPAICDIKEALGETWARQDGLLADTLALYQVLLRHYEAFMAGHTELEDGSTVRNIKVGDILQVINLITKLGQDTVTSKLNALRLIPGLEAPVDLPSLPSPGSAMAELIDDDDDGEWEDDDGDSPPP